MAMIERQITEVEMAIEALKAENGERYSIKQMEKTKKSLSARLSRLNDSSRKDNVVTFEQLGVDRLFVDESHNYKNLFLYTKMRNVAGIAQTEAQKSSDMFAKCQYMDELTGGKGITFATGTPISNSMTELYTNMRYLQYNTLQRLGLGHFDSWAASFGETQTAIELAPEGTGYRAKTRFAKFFNLPELIALFKESADIQTPDMLKLPVPEADYENIVLKPSEYQQDMVQSLADRAEAVRDRKVQPNIDNMRERYVTATNHEENVTKAVTGVQ
jgi:N12 class adenine-specific DNA methylase